MVRTSAADFDAVCMATALHKMASLDADPQQYKLLGDRPELTRLKDMIRESWPLNQLLLSCVLQIFKAACTCELCFIWEFAIEPGRGHVSIKQSLCKRSLSGLLLCRSILLHLCRLCLFSSFDIGSMLSGCTKAQTVLQWSMQTSSVLATLPTHCGHLPR